MTGEFISGQKYVQHMIWATGLDAKGRTIEAKGARWKDSAVMADRSMTPISYMLDGKQYVLVIARPGPAARVFTFVLDGKEPMPPAPLPPARGGAGKAKQ